MKFEDLRDHLKKYLANLYIITTDEYFLLLEASNQIREKACASGFKERSVLAVSDHNFRWEILLDFNQSQSLFGRKRLIELRIPTKKIGKDGCVALQQYGSSLNVDDNVTIVSMPRLDLVTRKAAWFTELQEKGIHIDIPLLKREDLPKWIASSLAKQQQSTDQISLELIADRVEGNLLEAHQEIQKLRLLYPAGVITLEQCKDSTDDVAHHHISELNEALLKGDTVRLVKIVENLKSKTEALPLVLWRVLDEIRTLLRLKIKLLSKRPVSLLLKEQRIWGKRGLLMEAVLPHFSLGVLQTALIDGAKVDMVIKNVPTELSAGDGWEELLQLVVRVSQERN